MLGLAPRVVSEATKNRGDDKRPIDMALNHGTYCSQACLDVLKNYATTTSMRHFPTVDNRELREVIAEEDGVEPEHVFVANGSGPLLKLCIPHVIEKRIKSRLSRIARHLVTGTGYPIITPRLTYFKVPAGASKNKLHYEMLPLGPENQFQLSLDHVSHRLSRGDALIYLSNPNNPTGNVLVTVDQIRPLLKQFPQSTFVIDEAYVQYLDKAQHAYFTPLVKEFPNLMVLRSFSFAYGLGGVRIGYAVTDRKLVEEFEAKTTPHRVNQLASDIAIAAIRDQAHLDFVRTETLQECQRMVSRIQEFRGLEAWNSLANFFLCRFTDGRTGRSFYDSLLKRGIRIKIFDALPDHRYDEYFRITIGTSEENDLLLELMSELLS